MILNLLVVATGSAAGGVLRYLVAVIWARHATPLPWWTLFVNLAGSAAIGATATLFGDSLRLRLLVITGFCGGFTTFSAFSFGTLELLEKGAPLMAAANVLLNVVPAIAACWFGAWAVSVVR